MGRFEVFALKIAGLPAEEIEFRHSGVDLRLFAVPNLEALVDRNALLREDETPEPPYWAHLWVGARALARALAEGESLAGKRALDLGCGLGLTGLVAAAKGAETWLADREENALEFVRESARRNGLAVHPVRVDFTRDALGVNFDVMLGAEVVYDPAAYAPLAAFVDHHLVAGGVFHVTDAFRSDATVFFHDLEKRGFRGERRAVREWEDDRWQGVFLWSFAR